METSVTEIAPDIFRLSTYIPEADFMFNQFLVTAEEPLLSTPVCVPCFLSYRQRSEESSPLNGSGGSLSVT